MKRVEGHVAKMVGKSKKLGMQTELRAELKRSPPGVGVAAGVHAKTVFFIQVHFPHGGVPAFCYRRDNGASKP
jgi:hypothetical protein